MFFLNRAMVRAIHSELIMHYGGSHGVRDENLLESAIARPHHLATCREDACLAEPAAVLGWGLIKNHAFADGNKPVGFAAMVTFLKLNGHTLTATEVEETAMTLRAAAGDISEEEWTEWVSRSLAPAAPDEE